VTPKCLFDEKGKVGEVEAEVHELACWDREALTRLVRGNVSGAEEEGMGGRVEVSGIGGS